MKKSMYKARGKLCQSLDGPPPGMAQERVFASEGRQRYKNSLKNPKHLQENRNRLKW
jgi:hypothetical protein